MSISQDLAYLRAADLDEALRHLEKDGACVHGGGSDLVTCLREGTVTCAQVISIGGLDDLRAITPTSIGALATIAELGRHEEIERRLPALAAAARAVGSPQLRNQGTLGGNLCQKPRCWYWRGDFHCLRQGGDTCYAAFGQNHGHAIFGAEACVYVHPSDTAVALTAYEARVRIAGPGRSSRTRTVPVDEFFVLPADDPTRETVVGRGEIVTAVEVPAPPDGHVGVYRKIRARGAWDFALTSAAIVLAFEGGDRGKPVRHARLVLGGVAPAPWRAAAAEQALVGRRLDESTIAAAAEAAVADASALDHNGFKIDLVQGVLREELQSLAG
ncbi:xanthine dehydrogenase family protein subunit M [bacterium]|nr:xanthine dehydrogenase family protein subunit M [bacterium]